MAAQALNVQLTAEMVADALSLGIPSATLRAELEEVALKRVGEYIWDKKQQKARDELRTELQTKIAAHDAIWNVNEPDSGPPA